MQDSTLNRWLQHTLQSAKWAFSTRRVPAEQAQGLQEAVAQARSGDLVLARVLQVAAHPRLQLADGRHSDLYEGDLIVAACGARYASDQFEGVAQLDPEGADLLAGGGCIGTMRQRHARMKTPTRLQPLGLLCDGAGAVINLQRYALAPATPSGGLCVIGVVGASMNAGKTSAVAALVHGLERAGYRTAAIKATGTGAFGDWWQYHDAGASFVSDFTDAGMVSTYQQPHARLAQALDTLLASAEAAACEVAVVEFADGVLQQETRALLGDPQVCERFNAWLFAAADSLSAVGGLASMRALGQAPAAITGLITAAPLSAQEAAAATGLEVLSREALRDPAVAAALLQRFAAAAGRPELAQAVH
ncbi:hypothetical protein SRAA_2215 [Serpentinimonas raichei]|uniref:DUF1611 domain-containing protein n=1 Tax=Serpentinimonas raichei TaxID=1458425 RepID=A0A060NT35_9BURK|nr:hypothetical protein [Serpentinimonas raichei]BAO82069.1 hypothetical protein SRAA_2215 [Serpentinimonas raichei]